ncbi:methionyl-tRNA formyltransferase [Sulfuriroseicoccus oceanibius]|uniref:Methionyl-tRNA formyltransferase n=1 Tax=Sulfuriroseicoccus oceanibius TaxID=2707525 RepID=A0A6B3LBR8_9BACT|nr:methionyl-tRNA formyltransferase [Sulfuriroseicoccus oceanibius]QQL45310.1 methionyl-tRNA formyltransferase [Sulfuriroseicoccus oceanibius]
MRALFLGTGDIAIPSLQLLIDRDDVEVVGLVTQPDRPVGRKQVLTPPKIKEVAVAHGIPVLQPEKVREIIPELEALECDLFVVMAYGQLLPEALIELPKIACVNLHGSLLPRHRGASPIQAAIREGDAESGVTLMHVVKALDAGDIILKESTPIGEQETGGELHDRLADIAATALDRGVTAFQKGTATREPQQRELVTYLGKLLRKDGVLDWSETAERIERTVRAFHPWPGTTTQLHSGGRSMNMKIFPPTVVVESPDPAAAAGAIVAADGESITIACGGGSALEVTQIQPEGKRRMEVRDFVRGHAITIGDRVGS